MATGDGRRANCERREAKGGYGCGAVVVQVRTCTVVVVNVVVQVGLVVLCRTVAVAKRGPVWLRAG
jgi:hypothetical protein